MNCYQPMWLDSQKIFVPCGHCFACRSSKAMEWSTRLQLELVFWQKAGFITLTYAEDPYTLVPDDLTKFFKRLRKHLSTVGRKIKYFACGEYGDYGRPHYHAICFGLTTSATDRLLINKIWNKGRTSVDYVNKSTINYVTSYVMKKYSKERNKREYEEKGLVSPFQRTSRGIGLDYALAHGEELQRQLSVRLFTGRECSLPRYFVNKLGIDPERLKEKSKDSMVKYVSAIFKKVNMKSNSLSHLGFMMFHTRRFDISDKLINVFDDINKQKSYNWKSLVSLKEK